MQHNLLAKPVPWWKFGYVWLVFAGPAIVVVASFVTFYLAVTRPDPVVDENYYQKGIAINKTMSDAAEAASMAPATLARNHAATGVQLASPASSKP